MILYMAPDSTKCELLEVVANGWLSKSWLEMMTKFHLKKLKHNIYAFLSRYQQQVPPARPRRWRTCSTRAWRRALRGSTRRRHRRSCDSPPDGRTEGRHSSKDMCHVDGSVTKMTKMTNPWSIHIYSIYSSMQIHALQYDFSSLVLCTYAKPLLVVDQNTTLAIHRCSTQHTFSIMVWSSCDWRNVSKT